MLLKINSSFFTLLASLILATSTQAQLPVSNKPVPTVIQPAGNGTVGVVPIAYSSILRVNYIRTWEPRGPMTEPTQVIAGDYQQVQQTTQYFDGLGRLLQTVNRQASSGNNPKDFVVPVVYDELGREAFRYLPYIQSSGTNTSDGNFKMDPFNDQSSFYKNVYKDAQNQLMFKGEQFLYSQTNYEASPLNRVSKVLSPGNNWVGSNRGIEQKYLINEADEVRIWTISNDLLTYSANDISTNIPISSSFYAAGSLYKNITIDEHGNAIVEYKNLQGLVVLKKVQLKTVPANFSGHTGWLCTYYVYDDLDQLRFIIPPKAVEALQSNWILAGQNEIINELCFRYEYDRRKRLSAKKMPGSGWVYMVYDQRDRLVFTQDANLRNQQRWQVTLYDALNRPVTTGMLFCNMDRETLQAAVNLAPNTVSSININGQGIGSVPPTIVVNSRIPGITQYTATGSITFEEGFESESGANFTAEILSGGNGESFNNNVEIAMDPLPAGYSFIPLTVTYYDSYVWTNKTYSDVDNSKMDPGTNPYPETLPTANVQQAITTNMLITGERIRVIEDPTNLTTGNWLTIVNFYDSKSRMIQTQTDNFKGGTEIETRKYDFSNKVISQYWVHNNSSVIPATVRMQTTINYDLWGRHLETWKVLNDEPSSRVLIAKKEYNDLGLLLVKKLGQKRDETGSYISGTYIETQDYNYNIRGWLRGINADYSHPELTGNNVTDRWFGIEFLYDWGCAGGREQFSGNISTVTWRSKGDGVQRAYGFSYDKVNRLIGADFSERGSSGYADNGAINFDMLMGDGDPNNPGSAYDANGNIKAMKQWGMKSTGSNVIDELTYGYFSNSNKLKAVSEPAGSLQENKLGDFTDYNQSTDDFGYDLNGNLITDKNKKIGSTSNIDLTSGGGIIYNHLNLPWRITVKDGTEQEKGTITYVYDARGNKLEKRVKENASAANNNQEKQTITSYLSNMVYQQEKLQFINHEEGRIRYMPNNTLSPWPADYFLKDQLGNVRMVLTDEKQIKFYPAATLEGDYADQNANSMINQEKKFFNIDNSNIRDKQNIPSWSSGTGTNYYNHNGNPPANPGYPEGVVPSSTNENNRLYRVNATSNKTGLQFIIKVMSGDKVDIFGKSYYNSNQTFNNSNSTVLDVATILAGALLPAGSPVTSKGLTATDLNSLNSGLIPASFIRGNNGESSNTPKAYINYLLLNEQFKFVSGNASKVGNSNIVKDHWQADAVLQNISVSQNGYIYVYVSNESNTDVFFDNLQVIHKPGPLLEESHYYPFGLMMAGISSKALSFEIPENKIKFQGQEFASEEFSDGSGLDMCEFKWRMHDPQIGRFWQVDPLASEYAHNSTYAFSENKVTTHVELEGLEAAAIKDKFWREVAGEFQGLASWFDRTFAATSKTKATTENASRTVGNVTTTNSLVVESTSETHTNLGGIMSYIIRNNSNEGSNEPFFITEFNVKVSDEQKTEVKTKTRTVTNSVSIDNNGVVTMENGVQVDTKIKKQKVAFTVTGTQSSDGGKDIGIEASTGTTVKGKASVTYSTKGKSQSVEFGIGTEKKVGKTTTSTNVGLKVIW